MFDNSRSRTCRFSTDLKYGAWRMMIRNFFELTTVFFVVFGLFFVVVLTGCEKLPVVRNAAIYAERPGADITPCFAWLEDIPDGDSMKRFLCVSGGGFPEDRQRVWGNYWYIKFSPDGRFLLVGGKHEIRIYTHQVEGLKYFAAADTRTVEGTASKHVFWLPDSSGVVFVSPDGKPKILSCATGIIDLVLPEIPAGELLSKIFPLENGFWYTTQKGRGNSARHTLYSPDGIDVTLTSSRKRKIDHSNDFDFLADAGQYILAQRRGRVWVFVKDGEFENVTDYYGHMVEGDPYLCLVDRAAVLQGGDWLDRNDTFVISDHGDGLAAQTTSDCTIIGHNGWVVSSFYDGFHLNGIWGPAKEASNNRARRYPKNNRRRISSEQVSPPAQGNKKRTQTNYLERCCIHTPPLS